MGGVGGEAPQRHSLCSKCRLSSSMMALITSCLTPFSHQMTVPPPARCNGAVAVGGGGLAGRVRRDRARCEQLPGGGGHPALGWMRSQKMALISVSLSLSVSLSVSVSVPSLL